VGSLEDDLQRSIRRVPDWPKKGVNFIDITTMWKDGRLSKRVVDAIVEFAKGKRPDKIVGIEAR
jgi:adenine phosphoribosyltransferase